MKIMYVSHTKEVEMTDGQLGWKNTPKMVEARGHEVRFILRHQWSEIKKTYEEFQPDVVATIGIIGAYVCWLKKIGFVKCPIVHEWTEDYPYMLKRKYWYLPLGTIEAFLVRNSDLITTASPSRYRRALDLGKKAELMLYGAQKMPVYGMGGVRGMYNLKSNRFKIVYTGEQSRQKHVERIISAVRGLDCDLYLTDTPNPEMERIAPENVHFLGRLKDQNEVFMLIQAADLCVVTEDNDSVGKLSEYWQYKKPVLGPRGKLNYYEKNMYLSDDFHETIKEMITRYPDRYWDDFVKEKQFVKIPTWDEWVDWWLKEVKQIVTNHSS